MRLCRLLLIYGVLAGVVALAAVTAMLGAAWWLLPASLIYARFKWPKKNFWAFGTAKFAGEETLREMTDE
jgi:hypothetical protein